MLSFHHDFVVYFNEVYNLVGHIVFPAQSDSIVRTGQTW